VTLEEIALVVEGDLELVDVTGVDLIKRRVAGALVVASIHQPAAILLGVDQPLASDRLVRWRVGKSQQRRQRRCGQYAAAQHAPGCSQHRIPLCAHVELRAPVKPARCYEWKFQTVKA
jgi:hypothetical protein